MEKICNSCGDFFESISETICEECRQYYANKEDDDIPYELRQDDEESEENYIWRTCGIG